MQHDELRWPTTNLPDITLEKDLTGNVGPQIIYEAINLAKEQLKSQRVSDYHQLELMKLSIPHYGNCSALLEFV